MSKGMHRGKGLVVLPMRLVWCWVCGIGYPISPLLAEDGEEKKQREFCQKTHGAVLLQGIAGSFRSNKPLTEPIRKGSFDAIDNLGHIFKVEKWRTDINEPFRYMASAK